MCCVFAQPDLIIARDNTKIGYVSLCAAGICIRMVVGKLSPAIIYIFVFEEERKKSETIVVHRYHTTRA